MALQRPLPHPDPLEASTSVSGLWFSLLLSSFPPWMSNVGWRTAETLLRPAHDSLELKESLLAPVPGLLGMTT